MAVKLCMFFWAVFCCVAANVSFSWAHINGFGDQPLSKIAIHKTVIAFSDSANITAHPVVLGSKGEDTQWVTVSLVSPDPSADDWVGVFSPAKFNSSTCPPINDPKEQTPYICSAPIKYKYANDSNSDYTKTGKNTLKFLLINQREDFSFGLFSGGLSNPKLVAVSNFISFANPKAPLYPRLAQGKSWNEMTITWTSGYDISEAVPFVEWGLKGDSQMHSPAGTLTFYQNDMCGSPARTVGWRDPGFIHTSFLKDLWPNAVYTYRTGHHLLSGSYVWSKNYSFRASPYPGQDSLQRVIIFGDMGKAERDGSNEYSNYQPGSLNTTDQLIRDLNNIDIVFHIGDIVYSNGYISQWDQFTAQVEPITSTVPYMIGSGNHERDWPNSGSFYDTTDSGGECGVPAETIFYVPAENRAKFWYSTDYGMFHFCIADTEHDWREGSEQYRFIEKCLASVDRQKQPWLIFAAHRVLGYSSNFWYGLEGSFEEPMGRESLQRLWQKYKVDIAFYGHVHNYERTCPIYQNQCVNSEKHHYTGTVNGTIHVVVGGGGSHLSAFSEVTTNWSLYKDYDWGFVKLTAFNHSSLLFEYKKSRDGKVYDSFIISRDYRNVLACVHDGCEPTTLTEQTLWGHLPKLVRSNSKESVEYILQTLWRTRKTGLDAADRHVICDILRLQNDSDLDPLLVCLRTLIRRCVYENIGKDEIQKLFPSEVLPELQRLLTLLLQKFQREWREEVFKDEGGLPRLKTMTWDMANQESAEATDPVAVINLKLQNDYKPQPGELEVKFQLAKDTLETMVRSMYCIRDQLSNVGETSERHLSQETNTV